MALYRHELAICPWCGGESGHRVDHLYGDHLPRTFGPWYCEACRGGFSGTVQAPGEVEFQKEERKEKFTRSMALLRFDGKDGPVFFVMDHDRYDDGSMESDEANQSHQKYFFEEHSCPTNWLRECAAVIQDGDCDPHGFLDFVRAVDVQNDFDEDDDSQWPILFPEAFSGQTIDGTATEVRELSAPTDESAAPIKRHNNEHHPA